MIHAEIYSPLADQLSEFLNHPGPRMLRSARGQGVGAARDFVVADETRQLPHVLVVVFVHDPEVHVELTILSITVKTTARNPMAV